MTEQGAALVLNTGSSSTKYALINASTRERRARAVLLDHDQEQVDLIVSYLGNGASAAAVRADRSVQTLDGPDKDLGPRARRPPALTPWGARRKGGVMTEILTANAETWRIEVRGVVQGVGFRPFVHRLATGLGMRGEVRNAGGHVLITACGAADVLSRFVDALGTRVPEPAAVEAVEVTSRRPGADFEDFVVNASVPSATGSREIPPDLATCDDCLGELFDATNRRYRYAFTNCSACGPRATIVRALPYDRIRTTMRRFAMCDACAAEYADPADRRFHAEPIACPDCGPRLRLEESEGDIALRAAAAIIAGGGVIAVKGIGGYQLVCDAADEMAVRRVRRMKGRYGKPLAIMVPQLTAARALAELSPADEDVLTSRAAPILLAPRRDHTLPGVCDGMADIGLFLPYTPLHHLLLETLDRPLVVTSANLAGEPMIIDDETAKRLLAADGVLSHDRPILNRYDDSVVRSLGSRAVVVRRARGYAPTALRLPVPAPVPVLAMGAQLKHTFALGVGDRAVIGPHTGDLEDAATMESFETARTRLSDVHGIRPAHVICDLHPGYLSSAYARRWPAERRLAVQHHHAHVAAVAAEHGLTEPFLGVAYDGLGLGDDGTFWGGELLLATYTGYRRLARFSHAPMPGGAAAVRRPARMALGYLYGGEGSNSSTPGPLAAGLLPDAEAGLIRRMIARGVNSPFASSAGRLFDAAAALLGLCGENTFEGEAAMLLEANAAAHIGTAPLAWRIDQRDGLWVYDGMATLRDLLAARADGEPPGRIAAAFHATIVAVTVLLCERAATETGVSTVCLSGGVFQNRLLATGALARLEAAGFDARIGERVPVNDGGISYGQAAIGAALLTARG
ncbi:carbamoyltransferase HypF [Spongiactinospora sp. TRM90649]|uniref:carbamoyltransferase HypF n=1 Tax=Spongiactinospora sp. TRM90649 TaxID=3031114 RepID=UPI0023F716DB|nr:carbamoyltransferase HypF [Spongiactinospora sp. TRM90649]MDF5755236.1 carbamoyltransferase HypF [Spongiactinospora sp. TRM90649]